MTQKDSESIWSSYDASFREDVHQLLAWGYEGTRHKINNSLHEEVITGFIAEAIEAKLNSSDIDMYWDIYSLKEDKHFSSENRTGKRRRRYDIVIESSNRPRNKNRPEYVFEAKLLCKNSNPISDYVGDEGLKRFLDGRYASHCPEAVMVGYIQSDDANHWISELSRKFQSDSKREYQVTKKLEKVNIISDLQNEWLSEHQRTTNICIKIFHVLLDCSTP